MTVYRWQNWSPQQHWDNECMWREEGGQPIRNDPPAVLLYEHHPRNIFPHWVVMGNYNHKYYGDMFRTKSLDSERHQWLRDNIGFGGFHYCQYPNQMWFAHEKDSKPAVCFIHENDAVLFKMWWS